MNNISQAPRDVSLDVFREDNQQEIDEFLTKVYEENIDKITLYSKIIQITQITSLISFLCFLVLLAIRVCPFATFSYLYLLISILLTIISLIIMMNMFLLMKEMIDSTEKNKGTSDKTATFISFSCLNIIGANSIILFLLIMLKLQGLISIYWTTAFIPLYLGCCVALFFILFTYPAFINNHLYFELILVFADVICIFSFGLLFSIKVDNNYNYSFGLATIPIYFVLGLHCLQVFINFVLQKSIKLTRLMNLFSFLFFLIGIILWQLKQDNLITNKNNWIEVFFEIIGFNVLFAETIYSTFFEQDNENKIE